MFSTEETIDVDDLRSEQEETDTRIFLHVHHCPNHFTSVIIVADDIDVLVIELSLFKQLSYGVYIKSGSKWHIQYYNCGKTWRRYLRKSYGTSRVHRMLHCQCCCGKGKSALS